MIFHESPITSHIDRHWRDLEVETEGILLSGNEIRSTFLKFFAERGYRIANWLWRPPRTT